MPTAYDPDDTPIVSFDPTIEISPFALFRRLRDGHQLTLVDCRPSPGRLTLEGAVPHPGADWLPPSDTELVLFDDAGDAALAEARRFQELGVVRARALFGGLELYEFSLDPDVVGTETYLARREASG